LEVEMAIQYKFVNGMGDEHHEKLLMTAANDGWWVKAMAANPSHTGIESNATVIVLMERQTPEPQ
jgi:hypothetical protein